MSLDLDVKQIPSLRTSGKIQRATKPDRGVFLSRMTPELLDPVLRLLRLLGKPEDSAVLAPLLHREILYRLWRSEQGEQLERMAQSDGNASQRQRNDFMPGLVHEGVHLEKENTADPASLEGRLAEELRTWRKVDLNVVRQLRRLNQPINPVLIEADDKIRSCGDKTECEPLREMLLPGERRR
jgi:hypothetical protein